MRFSVGISTSAQPTTPDTSSAPNSIYFENQRVGGNVWQVSGAGNDYSVLRDNSGTAYFFDIQQGDKASGDGTVDRSELSGNATQMNYGTEFDYSWRFGLAPVSATYPTLGSIFCNCGQMHNNAGSPCITFLMTDDTTLKVRTRTGTSGSPTQTDHYIKTDFRRGYLYSIRMKGRVDPDGTHSGGYLQVWINGVQVVDYTGNIGYTDQTQSFWKWGLYRSTSAATRMGGWFVNVNTDSTSKTAQIVNPDPVSLGGSLIEMMKIESLTDGSHSNGIWNFTADAASYTATDVPIGTAMADRVIALAISYVAASSQDLTSVTIQPKDGLGGSNIGSPITVSLQRKAGGSAATVREILGSIIVPDGTYADIAFTADGTLSNLQFYPIRMQGVTSNTVIGATSGTDITLTGSTLDGVNLDTNYGLVIASARIGAASASATWTGVDKIADLTPEGSVSISAAIRKIVQNQALAPSVTFSTGSSSGRLAAGVWH